MPKKATAIPTKYPPTILEINVPNGRVEARLTVTRLKPALSEAPRPAPQKIAKIDSHIFGIYWIEKVSMLMEPISTPSINILSADRLLILALSIRTVPPLTTKGLMLEPASLSILKVSAKKAIVLVAPVPESALLLRTICATLPFAFNCNK